MQIISQTETDSVDYTDDSVAVTDYKTGQNQFEIVCGGCGRSFFTDETAARYFIRQIEHDLDKPFLCGACESDFVEPDCAAR